MGLFGKSFEDQVGDAIQQLETRTAGLRKLRASISGKVVTLQGEAATSSVKEKVFREFNSLVKTQQTINHLRARDEAEQAASPSPGSASPEATDRYKTVRHPAAGHLAST